MKSIHQKKSNNYRFIALLCIVFLIQQLSFATLQNEFGFKFLNTAISQNNSIENNNSKHYNSELALFIEDTSEEKDEDHIEQIVSNNYFFNNHSFNAFHYTVAINTLYLRLASTFQLKVDLPFFVLYHAWKSDLA